jgi:hypothetical protein
MKTNRKHEVIARIARRHFEFVAILALMLSAAGVGRAQTTATPARVAPANPAAATQATTPKPAAGSTAPKGQPEGIQVHGHWVIEVKNPDGTVTARREFENAVQPLGQSYLASLLAGNTSPGGLSILLNGAGFSPSFYLGNILLGFGATEVGPCLPFSGGILSTDGPAGGTACLITGGASLTGYTSLLGYYCLQATPSSCSTNLTASAPSTTSFDFGASLPSAQIILSGSVPVTSTNTGQQITDVETVFTTCDIGTTPSNCVNDYNIQSSTLGTPKASSFGLFTLKSLNGPAGSATAPVSWSPNQTIAVTVTISFQ